MSITPQEALQRCIEHRELFHDEMTVMMRLIMSGEMSPELVAGLLVALRTKKETVGEIAKTGVDVISVGALTHSARALDLGLDVKID